ncbi:sn-glycerol-3-phosphate-binding periplasmic protein UgpB [Calidithermus terrae]|uniref:sn-glycerol-3-phosphate-binding periplasmic protein UgpB n=1 Tax=Calidithermus terrae TaxID=1408545 RepID=A0A399F5C6_9DEIN|nr:ABC transporter substrate-binding protein [Calidithermus terrae]RIH90965.1 sn-glycerol-3-phosphate-binding periplasmic protein UgpB [Calidithermus terrae]
MRVWKFVVGLGVLLVPFSWAQVEITVWHSVNDPALRQLIQGFNRAQDEVRVEEVYAGDHNELVTRLQAAVAARRQPEVVFLEVTRFGLFAERGVLERLEPYLRSDPALQADLLPAARSVSTYRNRTYVLPLVVVVPVMYYNKALFEQAGLDPARPPRTWGELEAAARRLSREGQWGVNIPGQWVRWAFVKQNGGEWIDEGGRVLINAAPSVAAYEYLLGLVRQGSASREAALKEDVGRQLFYAGRVGVTFDSSGNYGFYAQNVGFELGVAALPCQVKCAAPIGGTAMGMTAAAPPEKKRAAWAFMRYLLHPENNARLVTQSNFMPLRQSTLERPEVQAHFRTNPQWQLFNQQLKVAFPRPRPPAMPAIRLMEETVWQSMVVGQKTPRQALDDFAAEIRRLLAQP